MDEPIDPQAVPGEGGSGLGPTEHISPPETEGSVIGRYRLLQKIGEGGMGEVWLAEQKEPVRRRVAIKLVRAGMSSRDAVARFASERQALALMDHPAIAKVFDADSTPQGAPYFVMEYVAGSPITTYCDNHRFTTRQRLELFIQVCEGVQHAHQKAIIHRDLKPSNILVTELDGKAVPKIIDFGVAKALNQKLTADTMFTRVGVLIGTPEYMSPEQARSSGEDIDTRTDLYSLGIIFYELLAGAPPIELRKIAIEEFFRRLRDEDPPKPSTKIRTQGQAASTEIARKRDTACTALVKQIRGDLDSISLKALEKERSRRYGTPSEFAADIRRYLNDEPVLASPPSAVYRARKFARRHRAALATACAFIMVLVAAAVVSIRQSMRANREAAIALAINDFLRNDLLAQASSARQGNPTTQPDPDIKVRTALDRAAANVGTKFKAQPEVEAAIRRTIAKTYGDLGLYREYEKEISLAVDLFKKAKGPEHPDTLAAMSQLSEAEFALGKYRESEAVGRSVVASQRRVLGPSHNDTLSSMTVLAVDLMVLAKFEEGESILKEAVRQYQSAGAETDDAIRAENALGDLYRNWGKFQDAERTHSHALESARRNLGPQHPSTLAGMTSLGEDLRLEGKYADAEKLDLETVELLKKALGPEHSETFAAINNLGNVYLMEGKWPEAEASYRKAMQHELSTKGPDNNETLTSMHNVATAIYAQGRFAESETIEKQIFEKRMQSLGREHWQTILTTDLIGSAYAMQGRLSQAEALHAEFLEVARRSLGPRHPQTLITMNRLATAYRMENKIPQAEKLQSELLASMQQVLGPEHPNTLIAMGNLALSKLLLHQYEEAMNLLRPAIAIFERKYPSHWQLFRCESILGASLAGQKKYQESEPHLLKGYSGMVERKPAIPADSFSYLTNAGKWIVEMYQAWEKPSKVKEWRARLGS